ncbi:mammalian ependymin-related protein 1-like [Gigantopelta aegis]|uniref:mammalian ependymin-related protein 1-like n=1 Tax=Gigantopelta aegis TaxID=1735272 RepID=UPI001B88A1A4|nr:mammalian ependymin-related protein 1-like [Gigantopelta aegis]
MFRLLVLGSVFCIVFGQKPHPCESPKQFEGRFNVFDPDKHVYVIGRMFYDDTGRRFREIEEVDIRGGRDYYDRLYLHNLNLEYSLNLKTRKCNVTTLTRPFVPMAVPLDARYLTSVTIGASGLPDEHLSLHIFDGKTKEGNPYFIHVTAEACLPTQVFFESPQTGRIQRNIYDVTLGLRDPDAFIPPRECVTV